MEHDAILVMFVDNRYQSCNARRQAAGGSCMHAWDGGALSGFQFQSLSEVGIRAYVHPLGNTTETQSTNRNSAQIWKGLWMHA